MPRRLTFAAFLATTALAGLVAASAGRAPAAATSSDDHMDWWREARFGLFIHWGLYAVPAGEWGGGTGHGEWIRTTAQIPLARYDQFLAQFNPVKFNADEWCEIAKNAGMKYIVITSKHHDGFALFDSKNSDFDVMATPFRRDIMKELSEACARHGLTMCWYHSIMDWHHPDYLPRREWETDRPAAGADFDRFRKYLHFQVEELLANYGDIGVMWFDGEWENTWTHEHGVALYDHVKRISPNTIVNNRVDKGRAGMAGMTTDPGYFKGEFGTPEQEIPATGFPGVDWETCMTMNEHWGYNSRDANWKSTEDLLHKLIDIASKGGNFLLNVGPTSEGTFPQASIDRLREMGEWMEVNGEAIHGSSAGPFKNLPWGRCTTKANGQTTTLYLHVFEWPATGQLVVPGLGNEIGDARLLATGESLTVTRRDADVLIKVPASAPGAVSSTVVLEIEGAPIVYDPPVIVAIATELVRPLTVTIESPSPELAVRYTVDGTEPGANSRRYDGPITVRDTTTIKARSFHNGRAVSGVVEQTFRRATPRAAAANAGSSPGISRAAFKGDWNTLPDFSALTPASVGGATTVSLPPGGAGERVGYRFEGFIAVPQDDVYVFALTSDDGSRLTIGDRVVVDNDGLHGAEERMGTIALAAGRHRILVEWFNKTGGEELILKMGASGQKPVEVAPAALSH